MQDLIERATRAVQEATQRRTESLAAFGDDPAFADERQEQEGIAPQRALVRVTADEMRALVAGFAGPLDDEKRLVYAETCKAFGGPIEEAWCAADDVLYLAERQKESEAVT